MYTHLTWINDDIPLNALTMKISIRIMNKAASMKPTGNVLCGSV